MKHASAHIDHTYSTKPEIKHTLHSLREAIRLCGTCKESCQQALFNMDEEEKHMGNLHVRGMVDCIEMCSLASDFMTRGSLSYSVVCGVCADICSTCAKACQQMGGDSMLRCAEICWQCADTCRELSKTPELS